MSTQDLSQVITTGSGILSNDPQSGSILKLLGENGFKEKIESGIRQGHQYTIIHNPPSSEFLLVDMWNDGGHQKKMYHAFSVRNQSKPPSPVIIHQPMVETLEQKHPLIDYLKQLNADADKLLIRIQHYVIS